MRMWQLVGQPGVVTMTAMSLTIYHNPRCSKSRGTLEILQEAGVEPRVVRYLDEPPTVDALRALCKRLGLAPKDLVRSGEAVYKECFADRELDDEAWLQALHEHPVLIERPIVDDGRRALIGRPPERVRELL